MQYILTVTAHMYIYHQGLSINAHHQLMYHVTLWSVGGQVHVHDATTCVYRCHLVFVDEMKQCNSCTHTKTCKCNVAKCIIITLFVRILHSCCCQVILLLVGDVMPPNGTHLTICTCQVADGASHVCEPNVLKVHNVFHQPVFAQCLSFRFSCC